MQMKLTEVVNLRKNESDVYIGRKNEMFHFGNPFSSKSDTLAKVKVSSDEEAVKAFRQWINGEAYQDIESERREWILSVLSTLVGKRLGCFCRPKLFCHGTPILELLVKQFNGRMIDNFTAEIENLS